MTATRKLGGLLVFQISLGSWGTFSLAIRTGLLDGECFVVLCI